jgi:AraC-like DNA-binding protein
MEGMLYEGRFDIFALFMLLGISQGIFLGYYFLTKKKRKEPVNFFLGMLLVVSVIISSEILLNYTGVIVKVIRIENYSEPFVFMLMPLFYLIVKARLGENYTPEDHVHFLPFILYFAYCILYFLQPDEYKYNSYVYCYQPDWEKIPVQSNIPEDPLGLRKTLAPLYLSQAFIYLYLIFIKLKFSTEDKRFSFFARKDDKIRTLFRYWLHAVTVTIFICFIKIAFERDLGDYLIGTYISIMLYISAFVVLTRSMDSQHIVSEAVNYKPKYEKSSLSEEKKIEILNKLTDLLHDKKYFTRNMVSLSETARAIGEAPHHVSQVINEKTGKNFFDLLSAYRIGEAQILLREKSNQILTIEEIAEQVGYNSKAAFNKAFKLNTGLTPSEFRKNSV